MKIGTDVSLDVCKADGYLIMDFKKRQLIKKGTLDADCYVRFIQHVPEYLREEMHENDHSLIMDVSLTTNDIWTRYKWNEPAIVARSGVGERTFPTNEYELLSLADDVHGYCGLE